jgi:hypothetical protein
MTPEWLLHIGGMIFTAGAIYGALRGDIKAIHERLTQAKESAEKALDRIERHVEVFHSHEERT